MNSIQSDVSLVKAQLIFIFFFFRCYKVSTIVALCFKLKGGLYEDASVAFFYVFLF